MTQCHWRRDNSIGGKMTKKLESQEGVIYTHYINSQHSVKEGALALKSHRAGSTDRLSYSRIPHCVTQLLF